MPFYQIKIIVKDEKVDEFVRNLRSLWFEFLREEGCSGYNVYREFEKDVAFCLVGEFDTDEAMEMHYKSRNFEVLIGSATVLGTSFKMNVAEVLETGDLELAKSKIALAE